MSNYLSSSEAQALVQALVGLGLAAPQFRAPLLQFINPLLAGNIGGDGVPFLVVAVGTFNGIERDTAGEIPLLIFLQNAALLASAGDATKLQVVKKALDEVQHISSGAPRIDPAAAPETQERIIFTDDMVKMGFLSAGLSAGESVAKVLVPRFENGVPKMNASGPVTYLGTGWLLTPDLMVTNHHVVNARNEGEPDAPEADLKLQAQGTTAQFDFDEAGLAGAVLAAAKLEAFHPALDFAIVRIAPSGRDALRRSNIRVTKGADPVALNIIQHPGGRPKRYAIRNNLLSATTANDLRYFTDTDGGSSGSPVFNDNWEVVGLHRGSTFAGNLQFQGKSVGYINLGTQWVAIAEHLRANHPALAAEAGV